MSRARNDANRVKQDFTDSRSMTFPREQDQALKRILKQLEAARGTSTVAESDAKPVAKLAVAPPAWRGKGISQAGQ